MPLEEIVLLLILTIFKITKSRYFDAYFEIPHCFQLIVSIPRFDEGILYGGKYSLCCIFPLLSPSSVGKCG